MSKKKTVKTEETVVDTTAEETAVDKTATDTATEETAVDTPVTENTEVVADETATDTTTTDETVAATEETVVAVTAAADTTEPAVNTEVVADVVETPVVNTETPSGKQDIVGTDKETLAKLAKVYSVKFSFSYATRRFSNIKNMSIQKIVESFITNRNLYIAFKSKEELAEAMETIAECKIYYKGELFSDIAKTQLKTAITENTTWLLNHK